MDPIETLKTKFADQVLGVGTHAGQAWVDVKRERIVDILKTLRDECGYDMLTDLTAVDYLNQGMPGAVRRRLQPLLGEGQRPDPGEGVGPGGRPHHRHRVDALEVGAVGRARGLGPHGDQVQGTPRPQAHPAARELRRPPIAEGLPAHRPRRADGFPEVYPVTQEPAHSTQQTAGQAPSVPLGDGWRSPTTGAKRDHSPAWFDRCRAGPTLEAGPAKG